MEIIERTVATRGLHNWKDVLKLRSNYDQDYVDFGWKLLIRFHVYAESFIWTIQKYTHQALSVHAKHACFSKFQNTV